MRVRVWGIRWHKGRGPCTAERAGASVVWPSMGAHDPMNGGHCRWGLLLFLFTTFRAAPEYNTQQHKEDGANDTACENNPDPRGNGVIIFFYIPIYSCGSCRGGIGIGRWNINVGRCDQQRRSQ